MRHRPQPEHERTEPLDEDEQAKVVEDIEQEARRLDARARLVFAAIEALGALVFVGLFVAALLAPATVGAPGEPPNRYGVDHQRALGGAVPRRGMLAGYAATALVLGCGALRCAGARRCRGAAALTVAPILCWRAGFAAHAFAACWLSAAAPAAWALAVYVDADLAGLGADVSRLSDLRYRYKSI
jgi:hypothetical protein